MIGRIEATVLPGGEHRTLWIVDGRLTFVPQADAVDLVPPGGYVLRGFVDAHDHVDFPQCELPAGTREDYVRRNLRQNAGAGTVLLRDMGASARTLDALVHAPGEPRTLAAGRIVIGCHNEFFEPTAPDALVDFAVAQILARLVLPNRIFIAGRSVAPQMPDDAVRC